MNPSPIKTINFAEYEEDFTSLKDSSSEDEQILINSLQIDKSVIGSGNHILNKIHEDDN